MAGKEEEVQDTSDYKLDKHGRKVKAHRLFFNKGEDDGKKGVSEQMKKSFNTFVEQHTPDLTEEQLKELEQELNEVLGKNANAGEWIHDFVHSDNPKFAGKSKEKRKQMALAAYYAKKRNEEVEHIKEEEHMDEALKGKQHKLDKNKNGKLDSQDFKLLRKEDAELEEGQSHQARVTMKHIVNPTPGEKKAAKDIKPGIAGFRDRVAMLKSAEARGALKKEEAELEEGMKAYVSSTPPKLGEKGSHDVVGKDGKVVKSFPHSKEGMMAAQSHLKSMKEEAEQVDEAWPGTDEYKKKFPDTKRFTGRGERHDIEATPTGVKATRRFSTDDTAEKPENAPKRGRGRPKKDKFAEAVEFLIALDEEKFNYFMEEGFDSFFEAYEQLDELSKSTLVSYTKKATRSAAIQRKIANDFEHMADKSRKPSMKASASSLADQWKSKYRNRLKNVDKAVDRISK